jgi:hypothetical protein
MIKPETIARMEFGLPAKNYASFWLLDPGQ